MAFRVFFRASVDKVFSDLPKELQEKITEALFDVANGNFDQRRDIKKLSGFGNGYRIRVGRWRVIYHFKDQNKEIEVLDIFLKKGKEDYRRRG